MDNSESNLTYNDFKNAQTAKPVEQYIPQELVADIFSIPNLYFNVGGVEFQTSFNRLVSEYMVQLRYASPELRPYIVQTFWKKLFTEIIFGLKTSLGELSRKYNPAISEQHSSTYLRDDMIIFLDRFIAAVEMIRDSLGDTVITTQDVEHYLDNSFTEFRPTFKGVILEVINRFSHLVNMHNEMYEYLQDLLDFLFREGLMEEYAYLVLTNFEDSL